MADCYWCGASGAERLDSRCARCLVIRTAFRALQDQRKAQGYRTNPPVKVILCRVDDEPVLADADGSVDQAHQWVGGYCCQRRISEHFVVMCNDEHTSVPINRMFVLGDAPIEPKSYIPAVLVHGTCFVLRTENGVPVSAGEIDLQVIRERSRAVYEAPSELMVPGPRGQSN